MRTGRSVRLHDAHVAQEFSSYPPMMPDLQLEPTRLIVWREEAVEPRGSVAALG